MFDKTLDFEVVIMVMVVVADVVGLRGKLIRHWNDVCCVVRLSFTFLRTAFMTKDEDNSTTESIHILSSKQWERLGTKTQTTIHGGL